MMEENQDALVYFSLLEFRHQLMLGELYPTADTTISNTKAEGNKVGTKISTECLNIIIIFYGNVLLQTKRACILIELLQKG
ncbi:hypothetical protein S101395_02649 [Bacillus sonorensis]|uniref:Uncharacterized protein n=2 Tax=Bacillus sonorensis TaxID=119858 RepID=A0ABN5AEL4_9BACI|nr:hypothetical protein S101395_02649 [Bacillus sonorensis]